MNKDTVAILRGTFQGSPWVAKLTYSGGWECDNPTMQAALRAYDPDLLRALDPMDQRGWGVAAAIKASRALRGELELNPAATVDHQSASSGDRKDYSRSTNPMHYGKLNPVLPPPRRLLNPVEALLTARSPAQVRLHFARYRRALLYEWERDPKYQGAKGSKWIGTGDDAGKTPRYQASKPGSGRGKKEPATTGGRGKKDEGTGKGVGGKPSQKEAHADIVQHLRDVLSGEGEEADALFAKLQDRLQGMSPAERKEAAEKLGAVLGGKKPAAKKEPKAKPTPAEKPAPAKRTPAAAKKKPQKGDVNAKGQVFDGRYWRKPEGAEKPKEKKAPAEEKQPAAKPGKIADKPTPGVPSQASPEKLGDALKAASDGLKKFPEFRDGLIPMSDLYHELQASVPDLTKEQFHNLMWQLSSDRKLEFHVLNEVGSVNEDAKDHAIGKNDRMYHFVRLKSEVKSGKDLVPSKPAGADKQHSSWSEATSQPAPVPGSPVHEPPRLPEPPKSGELEGHKGRLKGLVGRPHEDQLAMTNGDADAEIAKLQNLPTPHLKELVSSLGLHSVKPTRKDMLNSIRLKLTEARRAKESIEV